MLRKVAMVKLWIVSIALVLFGCQYEKHNVPDVAPAPKSELSVSSDHYYQTYSGHEVAHLAKVYEGLKRNGCQSFIFYAGDSSLDNKVWIKSFGAAINGYEKILAPPRMKQDVDYWVNKLLSDGSGPSERKICSLMTSVEASTLAQRENTLLPQDKFVQDHLTEDDYLIVSVGGNDVALAPSDETKQALARLQQDPKDPQALAYFLSLMKEKTQKYVERLMEKKKPKNTLISMIYYPDQADVGGWPQATLKGLDYFSNPQKLQGLIDFLYQEGTAKIKIDGAQITPIELSKVLDGKTSSNYVALVEPSSTGGKKLAEYFLTKLFH